MKLVLLVACERVLQDPTAGASLISVFHGFAFRVAEGIELPPNAVIPKDWSIFSKWELEDEEWGKTYSSILEVFWPDGEQFFSVRMDASQPTRDGMAFLNRLDVFPVGQRGKLKLVQSLECEGQIVSGPHETIIKVNDPKFLEIAEHTP